MSQKQLRIAGSILTSALALLIGFSAFLKITGNEMAVDQAVAMGMEASTYQMIGFIEIISLLLFIIPRTGVLGSLLLIAYMGGAIVTHLMHQQPIFMAVVVQALIWITAIIRFPELRQRLFGTMQKA